MATFEHFYKSLSPNSQVRGKEFEKLVKWFLQTDPRWKNLVKKVWLWDEHPQREEWGPDCGIDLVFEDLIGNIWAVQAKCFDSHNSIRKEHMDSFIAESSDSRFQKKLLVATTNNIGPNVDRLLIRHSVVRILLDDLIEADVEYPENPKSFSNIKSISIPTPRDHQKDAIEEVNKRFKRSDRGQLIMACGTGKTLTAFWIKEKLKATNVLVLLPSLSLLSQTLKEWNKASKENFKWICICSDKTVAKKDETKDDWISNTSEIGLPVTSNSGDIKKFLKEQGKKITFSTYQSSPLIVSAQKDSTISDFDIVFADEAHRCAGKVSEAFGSVLDDKKIRSKKRLFLTATPRVLSNQIKGQAKVNDIEIASMDDASVFGEIFFKLSFSDAIKNKPPLLTDYQVVITGVDEPMINESILKRELYHWEKEKYKNDPKKISDSETLATMIALTKAIKNHDLKKLITFHGTVKKARHLSERLKGVANFISPEEKPKQELNCDYVYGKMKTKIRNSKLRLLKKDDDNKIQILSNARCLSEGVDVPALDGVAFIDPKKSQVDIIQAVGRAIRLSKDKKIGTIILPVFLGDVENVEDKILESRFADIWQIIIALKDQDDSLSEVIDSLRVELGKKGELTKKDKKGLVKIIFDLPKRVDRLFVDSLTTILVENTTENWLMMYGKLIKFTEENGHARPPIDKSELGNWVSKQRSLYLRKKLIKRRLDLLNKLLEKGWIWDAYEAYWFEKYELLKIYFQKNEHSNVPQNDPVLGKWVLKQRVLKNKNKLPIQKINLLKNLDFVWDAKDARWFMKYELLKDYAKKNGHANPPAKEKIIGSWVSNLRSVYDRKKKNILRKGEEKTLTKKRIDLLEKLPGWTWKALEDSWTKKYNKLHKILISVDQYKFSDLPNDLANWVSRQINCYEDLSLERKNLLKKLEKLGMRLENISEFSQKQWVLKIKNFYKINGHFVIPSKIDEGVIAGMIRQGYKKGTLNQSTIDELKNLEKEGWMWDPSLEISLEKIKLLKEWCKENNSLEPPRNLIIKGNNKTYVNNPKKKESERRNFNLSSLVFQLKGRYKYTKYEIDPVYKEYFPREKDKQIREMTPEEINEVESIKIDSGNWYWEPFDGYLRVFKECLERNIEIKQKTKVNFDLERFQNIGRWIQTVYTSNKRKTLEKYNYDKLKNIQSDYFRDLIYHKN